MPRVLRVVFVAALLAACAARAQVAPMEDLARFPQGTLEIVSRNGTHRFDVWIADTRARQSQGLMFVRELPPNRAMLFSHDPPRRAGMWMKNTYIELDMLFIADGRIAQIARRAQPHSLETVGSTMPVSAVVEIRGGDAERLGLAVGDQVRVRGPSAPAE
jgi:uncharacterized protein